MGTFWYGQVGQPCTIEDRMLLHLQVVIVTKLRRGERFLFRCDTDEHIRCGDSFWMSPDIPVRFAFDRPTAATLDSAWLTLLAHVANTTAGLWLVPEPVDPAPSRAAPRDEPELVGVGT